VLGGNLIPTRLKPVVSINSYTVPPSLVVLRIVSNISEAPSLFAIYKRHTAIGSTEGLSEAIDHGS